MACTCFVGLIVTVLIFGFLFCFVGGLFDLVCGVFLLISCCRILVLGCWYFTVACCLIVAFADSWLLVGFYFGLFTCGCDCVGIVDRFELLCFCWFAIYYGCLWFACFALFGVLVVLYFNSVVLYKFEGWLPSFVILFILFWVCYFDLDVLVVYCCACWLFVGWYLCLRSFCCFVCLVASLVLALLRYLLASVIDLLLLVVFRLLVISLCGCFVSWFIACCFLIVVYFFCAWMCVCFVWVLLICVAIVCWLCCVGCFGLPMFVVGCDFLVYLVRIACWLGMIVAWFMWFVGFCDCSLFTVVVVLRVGFDLLNLVWWLFGWWLVFTLPWFFDLIVLFRFVYLLLCVVFRLRLFCFVGWCFVVGDCYCGLFVLFFVCLLGLDVCLIVLFSFNEFEFSLFIFNLCFVSCRVICLFCVVKVVCLRFVFASVCLLDFVWLINVVYVRCVVCLLCLLWIISLMLVFASFVVWCACDVECGLLAAWCFAYVFCLFVLVVSLVAIAACLLDLVCYLLLSC